MRTRIIEAAIFSILILSIGLSAQTEEQSGMIKTAKGVLIVWNEPGNYFTIEVKGENITGAQRPLMLQVDGRFFQIQTAEKKEFLKNPNDKTLDDKAILEAHRDWEQVYLTGVLKSEIKIESEPFKLPGGQDVIGWSFKMPKVATIQPVRKQLYLSVVKRDHVLVLNTALEDEAESGGAKELLLQTLLTLKATDKPLSLQKASEMVKKN